MRLMDRYIAEAAVKATGIVLLVLMAIIGFVSLTTQLEDEFLQIISRRPHQVLTNLG